MIDRLRRLARHLKAEVSALALAVRDARTPWHARIFAGLVVAYALSPIDLVPDFIPVLGLLDDLLLVPLGLWLALRLIPPDVLADARRRAARDRLPRSTLGAALVVSAWLLLTLGGLWWWLGRAAGE